MSINNSYVVPDIFIVIEVVFICSQNEISSILVLQMGLLKMINVV